MFKSLPLVIHSFGLNTVCIFSTNRKYSNIYNCQQRKCYWKKKDTVCSKNSSPGRRTGGEGAGPVLSQALTRQNGGHEGREHEEQHGEEEEAGVAQDLLGLVPDPQVEQADEEADPDVRGDPQVRQDLGADTAMLTRPASPPEAGRWRVTGTRPAEALARQVS